MNKYSSLPGLTILKIKNPVRYEMYVEFKWPQKKYLYKKLFVFFIFWIGIERSKPNLDLYRKQIWWNYGWVEENPKAQVAE